MGSAGFSPPSASMSLSSTLPTALAPGTGKPAGGVSPGLPTSVLLTPPLSMAVPWSLTPTGVSLAPWMTTVRVAESCRGAPPRPMSEIT
ncbi:hypothetical protein FQZ97_659100 [compost metagenome]